MWARDFNFTNNHRFIRNYYSYTPLICTYQNYRFQSRIMCEQQVARNSCYQILWNVLSSCRANNFQTWCISHDFPYTPLSHIESYRARAMRALKRIYLSFQTNSIGLRREINPLDIRLLFFREIDEIWVRWKSRCRKGRKIRDKIHRITGQKELGKLKYRNLCTFLRIIIFLSWFWRIWRRDLSSLCVILSNTLTV